MRKEVPEKLERGRIIRGLMASPRSFGFYGSFAIQGPCGKGLVIVSSGADADDKMSAGWEHVSVSTSSRPPNWQEMCFVKSLCWDDEECVIQFHPPVSAYVNNHQYCLHLWRPPFAVVLPPEILVGVKAAGIIKTDAEALAVRRAAGLR